jgi:hypothetical protein
MLYSINYFLIVYVGLELFEMQGRFNPKELNSENEDSTHYSIS